MCGIAGFLNFENHCGMAHAVNRLQRHRGPDAQGIWSEESLSLAHQRLAIIDLDPRSNQPLEKNGLIIVFNGEIYNYKELRRRLEQTGTTFQTHSDTEVVLEAYRRFGARALDLFIGMFAFAIWSTKERSLFIARDHFGIKPLYYFGDGHRFAFGSELKSLARILPVDLNVSSEGLAASLNYLWFPTDFCILEGFQNLQPGHYMRIDTFGRTQTTQYWTLPEKEPVSENENVLIDILQDALEKSVERHLTADVEVAAFLSGGLDSSLICALAKANLGRLRTFTIGTDEAEKKIEQMPDDEKYAQIVAKKFGLDHQAIIIRPDIVKDLPRIVGMFDEPIGDPAAINTYLISNAAREAGAKVLLSGTGADEIFFGYRRQKAWLLAQRYRRLPGSLRAAANIIGNSLPVRVGRRGIRVNRWAKKFLSFANLPPGPAYRASYSYYSAQELRNLLMSPWDKGADVLEDHHQSIFDERFSDDPINRLCYTDINMFMVGLNLTYTDRASMAASTEVRVPFIDRELIELVMRIPGRFKYCNGESKYILKRVAERYLPKEIVFRPKASFGAPIRAWISNDLREMVNDVLSSGRLKHRGWLNPKYCSRMIEEDRQGRVDYSYQIYQFLTLELWAQSFLEGPRADIRQVAPPAPAVSD